MESNNLPRIAIVSFPWESYAPYKFLSDLIVILDSISCSMIIINGNTGRININSKNVKIKDIGIKMHYVKDKKPKFYSAALWMAKCILAQVKINLELIRIKGDVDIIIFYTAYPYYLLPLLTSHILGKKTVEVVTRSKSNTFLSKIVGLQDQVLFRVLTGISPESKTLIEDLGLEKYKKKLLPEGARFIDTSRYFIKKRLNERKNIIGFIGRLREEKGIVEFVNSIPLIVKERKGIEFIIGGSGDLSEWVTKECNKFKQEESIRITIPGWIGEELPDYLNELRLLVLPTHADSFPTIILEAMACGTPVLTISRGAISDVIKDGETGFIMENNSPVCIAKNVVKALNYSDIDSVVNNARTIIEENYVYTAAVSRYKKILSVHNQNG